LPFLFAVLFAVFYVSNRPKASFIVPKRSPFDRLGEPLRQ
jgi:hypothetical protein